MTKKLPKIKLLAKAALLVSALLAGVLLGCWLAIPGAALVSHDHAGAVSPSALLLPVLTGCCFVLLVRLVSCLPHRLWFLTPLMMGRGILFGYWFFSACRQRAAADCLYGILIAMICFGLVFQTALPRPETGRKNEP